MKKEVRINPSKDEFKFGGCAPLAICGAFNIQMSIFRLICEFLKIRNYKRGLTFWECKKIINALLRANNIFTDQYTPNHARITYLQMAILLPKYKYIVLFDHHLSLLENGEIFDSFFMHEKTLPIPTGWWRISY